jgi:hypothetical protein
MLSENLQATRYIPSSALMGESAVHQDCHARRLILEADVGMIWDGITTGDPTPTPASLGINRGADQLIDTESISFLPMFARPSSRHSGVVVASFCDGRVTTLKNSLDYQTFRHLMTPDSADAGLAGVFDASGL